MGNYSNSYQKSCPKCGGESLRLGAGRKPGEASLHCRQCKKFIKWLNSSELKALVKGGKG